MPCEARGPLATVTEVRLERPDEQRLAREEDVAERLAVLRVPELFAREDAAPCPPPDAAEARVERQVEPDERVGAFEDQAAEEALVVAVDDPTVQAFDRLENAYLELLGRRLAPVRSVEE